MGLLNAILNLAYPIVEFEILDRFNHQDYETDKLSIVDVKAVDSTGAIYHVEVQLKLGLAEFAQNELTNFSEARLSEMAQEFQRRLRNCSV